MMPWWYRYVIRQQKHATAVRISFLAIIIPISNAYRVTSASRFSRDTRVNGDRPPWRHRSHRTWTLDDLDMPQRSEISYLWRRKPQESREREYRNGQDGICCAWHASIIIHHIAASFSIYDTYNNKLINTCCKCRSVMKECICAHKSLEMWF